MNWITQQEVQSHEMIVYDAIGRILEQRSFRGSLREIISLETYARGTYMVQIRSENEVVTKRFFRQ